MEIRVMSTPSNENPVTDTASKSNNQCKPGTNLLQDFMASLVVFLVALPLCLGIAQACALASDPGDQARAAQVGILTGVVGGILVGSLAGCPLQVSGPAAGLVVLVLTAKNQLGIAGFGWAVTLAGLFQISWGLFRLGAFFRAISPAVIHGMLSGIGLLIALSQSHVLLDHKPDPSGNGLKNLLALPGAILHSVIPSSDVSHDDAALLGIITIGIIIFWARFQPKVLKWLPGPLIALLVATLFANLANLPVRRIQLAGSLDAAFYWLDFSALQGDTWLAILRHALAIGLVASAESLLCASAVDTLTKGKPSDNNKELIAQGMGNTISGFAGLLPITGVIVRSSANIQSGGSSRASTIFHGFWLLGMVLFLPGLLALIPTGALASVLVYTGFRLVDVKFIRSMATKDRAELAIFLITMILTVVEDLLIGVISGFVAALIRLLWTLTYLGVKRDGNNQISFIGNASFLRLPQLDRIIRDTNNFGDELIVDMTGVVHMDHAFAEAIRTWKNRIISSGKNMVIILPPSGFLHL